MDKVWHKHYEKGVPAEIDMNRYSSIVDLFEQSCTAAGNRPAYRNMGTDLSYAELDAKSRAFASYLTNKLGLKKGDRLAIMLPNLLQYPVALFGALRAGLIVVNVNPLYTATELTHLLNDSGTHTILILANFAQVMEEALGEVQVKNIIITQIGDLFPGFKGKLVNFVVRYIKRMVPKYHLPNAIPFNQVLTEGEKQLFTKPPLTQEDIAFLQYTGGTTGVSKGAILTHGNIIANMLQLLEWTKNTVVKGEEIIITPLPLYHIFSLTANCLLFIALESLNVLITNPRDIANFIKELKSVKFTAITGVNTLFNALLNNPKLKEVDFSKTRFAISGAMATQKTVAEEWQRVTGHPLIEGYGLTEASPVVSANPFDIKAYSGSIGLPVPSTDVCIRDEKGNEVDVGKPGELCVKGPQVMQGYWNSPELTKNAFTEDGWLKSGDIAIMDKEGFFYIVDRKKDTIIVSGFNVFPNEVEEVITSHPGVLEAAVIGVSDTKSGEMVKAFIVKKDPALTKEEVIDFSKKYLTRYKLPKSIEFRDDLPKTPVGKILRRALRE